MAVAARLSDYDDLLDALVDQVDNEAWAEELAKSIVGMIDALRNYAKVASRRFVHSSSCH